MQKAIMAATGGSGAGGAGGIHAVGAAPYAEPAREYYERPVLEETLGFSTLTSGPEPVQDVEERRLPEPYRKLIRQAAAFFEDNPNILEERMHGLPGNPPRGPTFTLERPEDRISVRPEDVTFTEQRQLTGLDPTVPVDVMSSPVLLSPELRGDDYVYEKIKEVLPEPPHSVYTVPRVLSDEEQELLRKGYAEEPVEPDVVFRDRDTSFFSFREDYLRPTSPNPLPNVPDDIRFVQMWEENRRRNPDTRRRDWVEENVIRREDLVNFLNLKNEDAGLPEGHLRTMALIESSFDPTAETSYSIGFNHSDNKGTTFEEKMRWAERNYSAKGLFQFIESTAKEYGLRGRGFDNRLDYVASTDAATRMAKEHQGTLRNLFGREPVGWELYLMHQQGPGITPRLFTQSNRNVYDVFVDYWIEVGEYSPSKAADKARKSILDNGGRLDQTAGEFANKWKNRYLNAFSSLSPGLSTELDTSRFLMPLQEPEVRMPPERGSGEIGREILEGLGDLLPEMIRPDQEGLRRGPSPYQAADISQIRSPGPFADILMEEYGYPGTGRVVPESRPTAPTAQELIDVRGDLLSSMVAAQRYGIETQRASQRFFQGMSRVFGNPQDIAQESRNRSVGLDLMRRGGLTDASIEELTAAADDLVLEQLRIIMDRPVPTDEETGLDLYRGVGESNASNRRPVPFSGIGGFF